uniref:SCP domain-containing protein n=1 Tax=Strongyloides venezuelensis TaxID=75913 RepID=A0A0K0FIZ2_STRVS
MRISIIACVSILFIINLVKTQELAVTYMIMYMGQHRKVYSYRERLYATIKQMLEEIIRDHTHVEREDLLTTKISSIRDGVIYKKEVRKYRNMITGAYETHVSPYLITEYFINGKLKYICNGRTFQFYYDAIKYAIMLKRKNRLSTTRRPSLPVLPPPKNVIWAGERIYCRKFWLLLWRNCDYYCYSRNNFEIMKQKFLLEINYYREKYGAGKLVENRRLSVAALIYLKEVISLRSRIDLTKFENVGRASLARAPLIVNHWFGEHKHYNFKTFFGSMKTRHFTAIVWKGVKEIGIGVLKVDNEIYIKVMYDKIVNMPHLFKQNVLKKVSG